MRREARAGQTQPGLFLDQDRGEQPVGTAAATGLGQGGAEKALLASLLPHLTRGHTSLFPVTVEGRHFLFKEFSGRVTKSLVIGAEDVAGE